MWLALTLGLLATMIGTLRAQVPSHPSILAQALALEVDLAQDPDRYYLIVDLSEHFIDLKAGARRLKRWKLLDSLYDGAPVTLMTFKQHLAPSTPEPGPSRGRIGGRSLPLDFKGRLTEGPRSTSRLYFQPPFLIQGGLPSRPQLNHAVLSGQDIRSLTSALEPGTPAILIPASEMR